MDFFIGIEAEGYQKGTKTLFIGDVPFIDIDKLIIFLRNENINRVYFGANNFMKLPFWFNEFIEKCPNFISIIAEIKNPKDTLEITNKNRVCFVLYIDINEIQEIKTIKGIKLTWTRLIDMKSWINYTNDLMYKQDVEIKKAWVNYGDKQ